MILEAQRRFQEALVYSDDPEAIKTFQDLTRVRGQLSKLIFAGPGKKGLEAYKKKMVEYHPDKFMHAGDKIKELAHQESKAINEAYNELKKLHGQ